MPAYFLNSGILFGVAMQAAKSAAGGNSIHLNALTAAVFAVVSAEAFINEAIELASELVPDKESDPSRVTAFAEMGRQIEEFHGSLELKYQVAKWVFSGAAFDKASNPYQDFATLVATRNALVHFKLLDKYEVTPEGGMSLKSPIPILDRLRSKNVLSDIPAEVTASWLHRISTAAMATWSCGVVTAMVKAVASIPPEGLFKIQMGALVKGFEI